MGPWARGLCGAAGGTEQAPSQDEQVSVRLGCRLGVGQAPAFLNTPLCTREVEALILALGPPVLSLGKKDCLGTGHL